MQRTEKERVVEELSERLRATESLIVADYRGLTNSELAALRTKLRAHGAQLTVVKNTLTRRAAEAAGADVLLALLEGPTAIAFVESQGDPVAVAKALADTAKDTKILSLRGGMLSGKPMSASDVEELAKLPAVDALKGQLVGVIVAPVTQLVGLLHAPLQDLVGLIDARIAQLGESEAAAAEPEPAAPAPDEPAADATAPDEPAVDATATDEVAAAEDAAADEHAAAESAENAVEPEDGAPAAEAGQDDAVDETADTNETDETQEEQD
jgi:large subunit ribosomal protein L10